MQGKNSQTKINPIMVNQTAGFHLFYVFALNIIFAA